MFDFDNCKVGDWVKLRDSEPMRLIGCNQVTLGSSERQRSYDFAYLERTGFSYCISGYKALQHSLIDEGIVALAGDFVQSKAFEVKILLATDNDPMTQSYAKMFLTLATSDPYELQKHLRRNYYYTKPQLNKFTKTLLGK